MKHLKIFENVNTDKQLVIMRGDDWEGVYYEGKLLNQGHSIRWDEVLMELGYTISTNEIPEDRWEDLDWSLPDDLDEVKAKLASKKYNI